MDFDDPAFNRIRLPNTRHVGFEIADFSVYFEGLCQECKKRRLKSKGLNGARKQINYVDRIISLIASPFEYRADGSHICEQAKHFFPRAGEIATSFSKLLALTLALPLLKYGLAVDGKSVAMKTGERVKWSDALARLNL
jgi:hypothetical protein